MDKKSFFISSDNGLKIDMGNAKALELFNKLNQLYLLRRDKMMKKWRRCLPFNELFVDRWEKARYLGFGEGASVYDSCLIIGDVKVGKHTWIGPFTILDGSGGLEIGDYCSISAGVQIYTHDSVAWAISGGAKDIERAPTKIGSRSYIGPNTVIGRGVTIGEGCIIGAFSLVLNDIKSGSSASGIPCKVKRKKC